MRLKTYFASGVDAAIQLARTELGDDALLVHSKKTSGEAAEAGAYEVVFAMPDPGPAAEGAATGGIAEARTGESHAAPAQRERNEDLAGLREAVEMTLRLARRSEALLTAQYRGVAELADLASVLEEAGFSGSFRIRCLEHLQNSASPASPVRGRAGQWLQRQMRMQHTLGTPGSGRKCVALLGPAGAGKTLSLVKMAARFGVTGRRPAHILSLDTERIAGIEVARAYAGILGIGFQALDSTHALSQALAEHANKDLVLIDTPGMSASAADAEREMASFFAARKDIDKHLVLPATASSGTLLRYVKGFNGFAPDKLLFTRLDEVDCGFGPLIETAIESGLPLSFCGTGPSAPDDFEEAHPALYCERMLPLWLNAPVPAQSKQAAA